MRFRIMKKWWNLFFSERRIRAGGEECRGVATVSPGKPREIVVDGRLVGEERLEVILHELVHAAGWHIDEEFVTEFAKDAARLLWRLGYRG